MKWLASIVLCWTVLAQGVRAIDGDTIEASLSIFVNIVALERIRLLGIDTPERTKTGYAEAKAFTSEWINRGAFTVETCRRDAFGRLLGKLTRGESSLTSDLLNQKLGEER
jgi:endonuclease YncB( thermonuclease family)